MPALAAWRRRPVAKRPVRLVWLETTVFSRPLPCLAIVTWLVTELKAATF
jgi:hypothetical protein